MSFTGLAMQLRARKGALIDEVTDIMETTVREAEEIQRNQLDRATTRYGEQRFGAGQGGSAGRNDSGDMINAINSEVTASKTRVVGRWGWIDEGSFQRYFAYQENGTGRVPAAHSLLDSYMVVKETFKKRMRRLGR
jgi:hypothetical protein